MKLNLTSIKFIFVILAILLLPLFVQQVRAATAAVAPAQASGTVDVSEAGAAVNFGFALANGESDPPVANVTLTITASSTGCLLITPPASDTLTFTSENFSTTQNFAVAYPDDSVFQRDQTCTWTLTTASADPIYNGLTLEYAFDLINDLPETPTIVLNYVSGYTDRVEVSLSHLPLSSATVTIAGYDPYLSFSPATLTFTVDNWSTPQTVIFNDNNQTVYQDGALGGIWYITVSSDDALYNAMESGDNDYTSGNADNGTFDQLSVTFPVKEITDPRYFASAQTYNLANSGEIFIAPIGTGDFNGDGRDDILVFDADSGGLLNLVAEFSQTGDTPFQRVMIDDNFDGGDLSISVSAMMLPKSSLIADFNSDGRADVAFMDGAGTWHFYSYRDSVFVQTHTISSTMGATNVITSGDFDGDGYVDIVKRHTGANLAVYFGNNDGTFDSEPAVTDVAYYDNQMSTNLIAGDFNGDGKDDLLASGVGSSGSFILLNDGDGTFTAGQTFSPTTIYNSSVADLNGDDYLDLIINDMANVTENIFVYFGNGDGTFQSGGTYDSDFYNAVAYPIDVNADGQLDLVSQAFQGSKIAVWLNDGDGTFTKSAYYNLVSYYPHVADFNADSKPDVLGGFKYPGLDTTTWILFGAFPTPVTATVAESVPLGSYTSSVSSPAQVNQIFSGLNSPPASTPTITPTSPTAIPSTLALGSTGEFVELIQAKLIKLKLLKIKMPTGYYGPATKAAIKQLQKKFKLPQTGKLDNATTKVLQGVKL